MKDRTPYQVRYAYANGPHQRGDIVSRHRTLELANAARDKHPTPTFLIVVDTRDEQEGALQ